MDFIEGVILTPLKIIEGLSGDVFHAMQQQEKSFAGFGEAYFSTVKRGAVKGWKKHQRMILNLIVPEGSILFVLYDGRMVSTTKGMTQEVTLSRQNYQRLTVPPEVWMSFRGLSEGLNLLLNIASIPHDPTESDNLSLQNDIIPYQHNHS